MKYFTYRFIYSIAVTVLPSIAYNTANAQSSSSTPGIKYVRMDIGHGALHCPFLSPKLESELKKVKDVSNFFIDRKTSYITFELPTNTEVTNEMLKKIGTDVGYPSSDVIVYMDTKPIVPVTSH